MTPAPHRRPAEVEIRVDPYDADGRIVVIDGVESSYVDVRDPTRLEFEYVRWTGAVLDLVAAPGVPLRAVHLGGAGCTLARYLAATRPGSAQLVLDDAPEVLDVTVAAFGLGAVTGLRLRVADARAGLSDEADDAFDVVVRDAFAGDAVPAHLTTTGFLEDVDRVLDPDGVYVANVPSDIDLVGALDEAEAALSVFPEVALVAEPGLLRGRRYGNVVLVAGHRPLPHAALARRLAAEPIPARVLPTPRVRELCLEHRKAAQPAAGPRRRLLDREHTAQPPATSSSRRRSS